MWNGHFLLLLSTMALTAVSLGMIALAIPTFVEAKGDPGATGLVYAAWGVGSTIGIIMFGRSRAIAQSAYFPLLVLALAVGAAVPLLATTNLGLALALAVGGTPIAVVSAAELALITRLVATDDLAIGFTVAATASMLGEAVGFQVGGLVAEEAGTNGLFTGSVLTTGVAAGLAVLLVLLLRDTAKTTGQTTQPEEDAS